MLYFRLQADDHAQKTEESSVSSAEELTHSLLQITG